MIEASLAFIGVTDPFKGAVKSAGLRALKFDICHVLRAAQSGIPTLRCDCVSASAQRQGQSAAFLFPPVNIGHKWQTQRFQKQDNSVTSFSHFHELDLS